MRNPYNNKAMLPHDSDMFFGREKEMKSIESSLLACEGFVIDKILKNGIVSKWHGKSA